MDFSAGRRETITDVCAGDLVIVHLEHKGGKLVPDQRGRPPHLIYKPHFAGEDISSRRRHHLHGSEPVTPEWELDIGPFWAPLPGLLAIAGGAGDARFAVYHTVEHCRADCCLEQTLTFYRVSSAVPRPRGAAYVRVANPVLVRLSAAEHNVNVSMQPAGQRYPLGFATTVQPHALTTLIFGIVL